MSDPPSPAAARLARPRWLDARLVVGVLLVLSSMVAGARMVSAAERSEPVWLARHDLVPGERLTTDDVRLGKARLFAGGRLYVSADRPLPAGYVVVRPVGAGELLPFNAVAPHGPADVRMVTVPVQPGHLPPGIGPGDAVDVYVTKRRTPGAGAEGRPRLVLGAVAVQGRDSGSRGFGSVSSTVSVVLSVPADRVAAVIDAVQSGDIDLVRVPAAVAAAVPGSGQTS